MTPEELDNLLDTCDTMEHREKVSQQLAADDPPEKRRKVKTRAGKKVQLSRVAHAQMELGVPVRREGAASSST